MLERVATIYDCLNAGNRIITAIDLLTGIGYREKSPAQLSKRSNFLWQKILRLIK